MSAAPRKVLVLGVTGMLGHTLFRRLSLNDRLDVSGTARTPSNLGRWFEPEQVQKIITGVDAGDFDTIVATFAKVKPEIVINCIGIIKQLPEANEPLIALPVNALLPHRIAQLCAAAGARMVHISTDCVFDGKKGGYTEADPLDAADLTEGRYLGRSNKYALPDLHLHNRTQLKENWPAGMVSFPGGLSAAIPGDLLRLPHD